MQLKRWAQREREDRGGEGSDIYGFICLSIRVLVLSPQSVLSVSLVPWCSLVPSDINNLSFQSFLAPHNGLQPGPAIRLIIKLRTGISQGSVSTDHHQPPNPFITSNIHYNSAIKVTLKQSQLQPHCLDYQLGQARPAIFVCFLSTSRSFVEMYLFSGYFFTNVTGITY